MARQRSKSPNVGRTVQQPPAVQSFEAAEIEARLDNWRRRLYLADKKAHESFEELGAYDFDVAEFFPSDALDVFDRKARQQADGLRDEAEVKLLRMKAAWENLEARLEGALSVLEDLATVAPDSPEKQEALDFLRAEPWKQARQ